MTTPNETPTPRMLAEDRQYPTPEFTEMITFEGRTVAAISPEGYYELFEKGCQLERELASANTHLEIEHRMLLGAEAERDELRAKLEKAEAECGQLSGMETKARIERDEQGARAERAEAACAEMRALLEEWADELRHTHREYGANGKICTPCGAELHNHEDHKAGCVVEKTNALLDSDAPGQGWHSPEEWGDLQKAHDDFLDTIKSIYDKLGLTEENTDPKQLVSDTVKEHIAAKDARIAELEQQLAEARKDSDMLDWEKGPANGGKGTAGSDENGNPLWRDGDRLLVVTETTSGRDLALVDISADEDSFGVTDATTGDEYDAWNPEDWSWWAVLDSKNLPPREAIDNAKGDK